MKFVMIFVLLIILAVLGLWIYGFNAANDLSVSSKTVPDFKDIHKVLVIFPHPDDEANSLGGTITQFNKHNIKVDWVIMTRGEKGNDDAHYDEKLKVIRTKEAEKVAKILNAHLTIFDYPDNGMEDLADKLIVDVRQIISDDQPDLVVTYDQSGGYGHPDHIILSKVVTKLLESDFPKMHLWYTSTPEKLFKQLKLPEQMAKDANFKSNRKAPSIKIWVGLTGVIHKTQAIYAYQSQFASFVKSVPIKQIPLWFYESLTPYEYFYIVK